jgi:glycerol-3-phosphate acyltransferase PlsX
MRIGLDVSGGDFAPLSNLEGALLVLDDLSSSDIIVLIGKQDVIHSFVNSRKIDTGRIEIVHAPGVIGMDEQPTKAIVNKPDSSIAVGFRMLKHREIDAFASAGSSGAMVVGAIYSVNTIQGIIRPAAPAYIAKESGGMSILIDVGINPDSKPDIICQFGLLGSIFAKYVYKIEDPKVGLLNIGTEEKKGDLVTQSAYQLMKETKDFHFVGNVEGRDLFLDFADVIVCDGFVGNIVLKQIESFYEMFTKRGVKDEYLRRFNYELYGGSPILGINGNVVVGHGISSPEAVRMMIRLAWEITAADLPSRTRDAFKEFDVNHK